MKLKNIMLMLLSLLVYQAKAQTYIKGQVVETGSNAKMAEALITNTNNKQVTLSDANGSFSIPGAVGHTLIISSPGYVSDTLYIINMAAKQIKMTPMSIALREVNIKANRNFNPRVEYAKVYERSKVYILSPTSWFGKDAKDARRLKHYFEREQQELRVDSAFSRSYVSSLVPLRGQQLEDFMTLYRPSYDFVMNNNGGSMAVYINDSYKKYMALPPEKRKVQRLDAKP